MAEVEPIEGRAWEGTNIRHRARVTHLTDGSVVASGDVQTLTVDVYLETGRESDDPVYSATLTASKATIVVASTTGNGWDFKNGYTFDHTITAADFSFAGGKTYRVVYLVDTTGGATDSGPIPVVFRDKIRSR